MCMQYSVTMLFISGVCKCTCASCVLVTPDCVILTSPLNVLFPELDVISNADPLVSPSALIDTALSFNLAS